LVKGEIAIAAPVLRHPAAPSLPPPIGGRLPVASPDRFSSIAPIYLVAAVIVTGDVLGNAGLNLPIHLASIFAAFTAVLYAMRRPREALALALATIAVASSISAYAALHPSSGKDDVTRYADRSPITIEGLVARPSDNLPGIVRIYVAVASASIAGGDLTPATGTIRITVPAPARFEIGDEVRATGAIRFPYQLGDLGEFDYRGYLYRNGIAATMYISGGRSGAAITIIGHRNLFPATWIEHIRRRIGDQIDANLAQPERGVLRAIVLGDRNGIDQSIRDRFALTGMAHLLVISGLQMGLLAATIFAIVRLITGCFRRLTERGMGNKIAAAFALLAVAAYGVIAQDHVSTVRAIIMVAAYTAAVMLDRPRAVMASLAFAAIVICLAYPASSGDAAFQLTFAVVIVIVLGMRRVTAWRKKWSRITAQSPPPTVGWIMWVAWFIGASIAVSFWAMIGTAPLTARHFNQLSMVGLAANAVVVPIIGLGATVIGLAGAGLCLISTPAAAVPIHVAGILIALGIWLAGWFLALPGSWMRTFTPTWLEVSLAYGFIVLWLVGPTDDKFASPSRLRWIAFGVLAIVSIGDAGWWIAQRDYNRDLRVTFLAVGEGDAAVIRFPGSRVMVIDAGGSFSGLDPGETVVAPYLWSRKIMTVDYLVVSHPDFDHYGGIAFIARNFRPAEFWVGPEPGHDQSYAELLGLLSQMRVPRRVIDASEPPMDIGGVTVRCLGPQPGDIRDNDASMVLQFAYGPWSFLFTGDIEAPGERTLIASSNAAGALRSTVLKVPHHGSATSSTDAFVRAVDPALAVISLGYLNRYGFPSPAVVDRYRALGARVARTDETGEIDVDAGRDGIRLSTWREDVTFERRFDPP